VASPLLCHVGVLIKKYACSWHVDSRAEHVRFMGAGPTQYYGVQHDNRLEAAIQVPAVSGWHHACVVDTPHPTDPDAVIKYLVGPLSVVQVDPTVWGVGDNALPFFGYKAKKGTRIQVEFTAGNLLEPAAMLGHKTTIWSPSHNAMHVITTYQSTTTHGIW
jgi:hypothetical protein